MTQKNGFYTRMKTSLAIRRGRALASKVQSLRGRMELLDAETLRSTFQALRDAPESFEKTATAFACIREAAARVLGTPHYPVQLTGGLALLEGLLAEMRTGEGKTLTITLPAAMLALDGKGVHVVTANEYLAARDAALMRPVYEALGLTVGVTLASMSTLEKQSAYAADITYGVGSEFGFDYLKDNMARDPGQLVQRPLNSAIVDEVDSILIDEARVPLIISDSAEDVTAQVKIVDACVRTLAPGEHYHVNIKDHSAELTEAGYEAAERYLAAAGATENSSLYAERNLGLARMLHAAVKAHALYRKDRDYVVSAGELVLIDTGTGRAMEGRRLGDGLHEALEARENLAIRQGTVTRATITYQSYFGLYPRLAGLTGTAATDADEFADMYGLVTVVVPTNKPVLRTQGEDRVYRSRLEKFSAAVELVAERHRIGQPVLVGCSTIRDAELMGRLLSEAKIPHQTLTAKHVEKEADIIAQAGVPGAVTVATNMAGRGTDIILGGTPPKRFSFESQEQYEVSLSAWEARRDAAIAAGGLFVLGTERNGLRRVDNQLAGRSGRQGDPGEVQFLLSLEDELLSVFAGTRQVAMLRRAMEAAGAALGGQTVARLVAAAQKSVEMQGFSARKSLLTYDKTLADQRNAVYALRQQLLHNGATDYLKQACLDAVSRWASSTLPSDAWAETWDVPTLKNQALDAIGLDLPLLRWVSVEELERPDIIERLESLARERLASATELDEEAAKALAFDVLDAAWTGHLTALAELQSNAQLKGSAQQNAALHFPKEAFQLFLAFQANVEGEIARAVMSDNRLAERKAAQAAALREREAKREAQRQVVEAWSRQWVARHDACPCGSGAQYRHCHGSLAQG